MPRKSKQSDTSQVSLFSAKSTTKDISIESTSEASATTKPPGPIAPSGPLVDWRKKWTKNGNPIKQQENCQIPITCPDGTINSHPCGIEFIDSGTDRYMNGEAIEGWYPFCWKCGEYLSAGVLCNDL